jgi:hypothetical protein
MLIESREVRESTPPAARLASSGQQGFDHLVAQDDQRSQGTHRVWSALVAPCAFDPAHQLLARSFFKS